MLNPGNQMLNSKNFRNGGVACCVICPNSRMKSLFLTLFCTFFALFALAQAPQTSTTIQGAVFDSVANKPIGFVTVALQNAKTHDGVRSSLTKDDGSFSITTNSTQPLQLAFVFVGYKTKVVPVTGSGNTISV